MDAGVGSLRCLTFDPTGRYVATAGFGKTVRVIDSETWQAVATLPGHARAIGNLAFDPAGSLLASGGEDRILVIWDLARRAPVHRVTCDEGFIFPIAFSPDGSQVAAAAGNVVHVVELSTGKQLVKLDPGPGRVNGLDYSPDSRRFALAGTNRTIVVHRTGDWSVERLIRRPGVELTDVKFSPDGRQLASCGTDRLVQIWDVEDGRELFTLLDCVAPPRRLAFSRDGDHLAATGGDRSIRVWDLAKSPFAEGSEVKGGPGPP